MTIHRESAPPALRQKDEVSGRLPVLALAALAAMGFVLLAAETMPAGLLPEIAAGLGTGEAVVGQFISVWALGTVIVTIPAISLTRGFRRKPLLLTAIAGLLVMNTVTALSDVVAISLASRLLGGAFTGIIWGMLAAYGRRISPPDVGERHEVGLIAEQVLAAGLGWAVVYDEDGEVEGLHYERVALALIPAVQRLIADRDQARTYLEALAARVAALEGRTE